MEKNEGEYYKKLMENITIKESANYLQKSEYRDKYDGSRLYKNESSTMYVSKKAGDESNYWSTGKTCYDEPLIKKKLIYLTNNRDSFCSKELPKQFENKGNNRTVTRISEYSNALYNNSVFKNPRFISC